MAQIRKPTRPLFGVKPRKRMPMHRAEAISKVYEMRTSTDLLKHHGLTYSYLKTKKISFNILKRFLTAEQLHEIGCPASELIKNFKLKRLVRGNSKNPHAPIVPFIEMRKAGVPAKKLLALGVQIGLLMAEGKYTRAELVEAGVDKTKVDMIAETFNKSIKRFHRGEHPPKLF